MPDDEAAKWKEPIRSALYAYDVYVVPAEVANLYPIVERIPPPSS
jgi:hypothetical protein